MEHFFLSKSPEYTKSIYLFVSSRAYRHWLGIAAAATSAVDRREAEKGQSDRKYQTNILKTQNYMFQLSKNACKGCHRKEMDRYMKPKYKKAKRKRKRSLRSLETHEMGIDASREWIQGCSFKKQINKFSSPNPCDLWRLCVSNEKENYNLVWSDISTRFDSADTRAIHFPGYYDKNDDDGERL